MTTWRNLVMSLVVAASMFLTVLVAVAQPAQAQANPMCFSRSATIVGTAGDDVLVGTPGDDVIVGLGGNDLVRSLGGDDYICGGEGNDRLIGGGGNDSLFGDLGRDVLLGGRGTDTLSGGAHRDVLRGGRGPDVMNGSDGRDRCFGGAGADRSGVSCEKVRSSSHRQLVIIDGAEVWSTFVGDQLPAAATAVVFDKLILDNGSGPKLCTGAILTSDPPQCGTYLLNDFEMSGAWVEDRFGTLLGHRRLTISWPSVDGAVDVLSDGPTTILGPDGRFDSDFSLPEACVGLERASASTIRQLQKWARENPDLNGGLWIAGSAPRKPGIPVLQVKGDAATLDAVRAAISTNERTPCIVAVDFTESELARNQNQVSRLFNAGLGIWGTGRGKDGVHVDVDVADRATVEAIIGAVDRPELLRIEGTGAILD